MADPTPNDITRREADYILGMLQPKDQETLTAYIQMERKAAAARVERGGIVFGFAVCAVIVGVFGVVGAWLVTDIHANATIRAKAAEERVHRIEARCIEQIVCEPGGEQ